MIYCYVIYKKTNTGDALFEKRGSWTDEQTDYWEAHGMREGKPLVKGSLLPIVWQRKETP